MEYVSLDTIQKYNFLMAFIRRLEDGSIIQATKTEQGVYICDYQVLKPEGRITYTLDVGGPLIKVTASNVFWRTEVEENDAYRAAIRRALDKLKVMVDQPQPSKKENFLKAIL